MIYIYISFSSDLLSAFLIQECISQGLNNRKKNMWQENILNARQAEGAHTQAGLWRVRSGLWSFAEAFLITLHVPRAGVSIQRKPQDEFSKDTNAR